MCCAVQMNSGSSMLTALPQKGTRHASVSRHNVNFGHRAIAPNRPCGCVAAAAAASGRILSACLARISVFNQPPEHESPSYQSRCARKHSRCAARVHARVLKALCARRFVMARRFSDRRGICCLRDPGCWGRTADPSRRGDLVMPSEPLTRLVIGWKRRSEGAWQKQKATAGLGFVAPDGEKLACQSATRSASI